MKMLKKFAIVLLLSGSCGISAMDVAEEVCCETPVEMHPYIIVSSETLVDPVTGARLTFMGEPLGSVSNIEAYGDILTESIAETQALMLKEELLTQAALNALQESLQPVRSLEQVNADAKAKRSQEIGMADAREKKEMERKALRNPLTGGKKFQEDYNAGVQRNWIRKTDRLRNK